MTTLNILPNRDERSNTPAPDQQGNRVAERLPLTRDLIVARRGRSMLDCLGNAWNREACRLAQWTQEHLVNRTDVYGSYLPLGRRTAGKSNNYTAPANKENRLPGTLTTEIIEEHYRGNDQGYLIGLHAISPECSCKWFLVDIGQHGEDQAALAEANAKAAFGWYMLNCSSVDSRYDPSREAADHHDHTDRH